jgi:hypothetical protein
MTAQQAGVWTRRAFLRGLTLAGAAGVFGVYPRRVAAVEAQQTSAQVDTSSALGVCPPRDAICPNCCQYRSEAT